MNLLLLADVQNKLVFLVPLVVSISLVYAASRYEAPARIIRRSLRLSCSILMFMGVVFVFLYFLSSGL